MRYLNSLLFILPSASLAAQHTVEVGDDGKLVYNPDTVQAAVGDTVAFEFYPGGHSVAQSTFDNPCQPSANGIWSGFFNPSGGTDPNVFEITIQDTNPIWIYCAQVGHCNAGMAMVINPPASGSSTLAAYISAAANAKAIAPQNVEGGVVTAASAVQTSEASGSSTSSGSTLGSGSSTASESTAIATTSSGSSSTPATSSASAAFAPYLPSTSATSSASNTTSSSPAVFTGAGSKNGAFGGLVAMVGAGWFGLVM